MTTPLEFDEEPLRFIPPGGSAAEWPNVSEWADDIWRHWLREHNRYPYLRQWSEEDITQYLEVDRWRYGISFQRHVKEKPWWFYVPVPIAVPFHAVKKPNICFGGAAGGTKSHSARNDAYRHGLSIPGYSAIILRRTLTELERNHLAKAKAECYRINNYFGEELMEFREKPPTITFKCHSDSEPSVIFFGHCQHPGDENKYLSDDYAGVYPDEMATFERTQVKGVAGRLRSVNRNVVPRMAGTTNPAGAQTQWIVDEFIDKKTELLREFNPRYDPDDYVFIQAMLYDNPYYMDPDGTYTTYENRLFEYDPERRRQLLLGDWSALTGQFLPEFSESRHCAALHVPLGCKIERWIDWGYTPHYGICQWIAILPSGRIYIFAEWKFNGQRAKQLMVAAEVAQAIRRMTHDEIARIAGTTRITKSVADPSMWAADGHSGEDYAETFRRNRVPLTQGDNDRVLGWGRLRHWLRLAPDGKPWLMIHPSCTATIRSLKSLVRDEHDPDDVDTTGDDHPADAIRYGVMARPSPPKDLQTSRIIIPESAGAVLASLMVNTERSFGQIR